MIPEDLHEKIEMSKSQVHYLIFKTHLCNMLWIEANHNLKIQAEGNCTHPQLASLRVQYHSS